MIHIQRDIVAVIEEQIKAMIHYYSLLQPQFERLNLRLCFVNYTIQMCNRLLANSGQG